MPDRELFIDADGTARAVYADELLPVVEALGTPTVERASHVEFSNADGAWGVWRRDGVDTGKRFRTRAEALAWEVANVWSLI